MKKFVSIITLTIVALTAVCCSSLDELSANAVFSQNSINDAKGIVETALTSVADFDAEDSLNDNGNEPIDDVSTNNETANIEPDVQGESLSTEVPVVSIDYESLFDFSDWESEFNDADNKEKYIEEYWKRIAMNVFSDVDTYMLIKEDEKAKLAFMNEVKEEMAKQIEQYLLSSKITVNDEMRGFIDDMINLQVQSFEEIIH